VGWLMGLCDRAHKLLIQKDFSVNGSGVSGNVMTPSRDTEL